MVSNHFMLTRSRKSYGVRFNVYFISNIDSIFHFCFLALHKKDERLVDDVNEAAAVGEKEEDTSPVRLANSTVESEAHHTKSLPECTGCVQKLIEIDQWETKYKQEVEKYKELKKVYLNLTVRFTEVDSKYNALLKTNTSGYHTSNDPVTSTDDIFTPNEVKFLQCMALDKNNDCSFILHCLKFAYKLDPSVLVCKTLKGTHEWMEITSEGKQIHHDGKAPLTPKKVERIKGLFIDRISKCEIDSADYVERIKDSYVNKHIAAGIRNLSKKFK